MISHLPTVLSEREISSSRRFPSTSRADNCHRMKRFLFCVFDRMWGDDNIEGYKYAAIYNQRPVLPGSSYRATYKRPGTPLQNPCVHIAKE